MIYPKLNCILLQTNEAAEFATKGANECGLVFVGLLVVIGGLLVGVRIIWNKREQEKREHNDRELEFENTIKGYHDEQLQQVKRLTDKLTKVRHDKD